MLLFKNCWILLLAIILFTLPFSAYAQAKKLPEKVTNVDEYIFEVGGDKVFKTDVYTDFSYYYIDLKAFLKSLKIDSEKIDSQNSFRFKILDHNFSVNPQTFVIKNSEEYPLSKFEYISLGSENFLIEISAFARIFKLDMRADHPSKKIYSSSSGLIKKKPKPVKKQKIKLTEITNDNINEDNLLVFEIRVSDLSYDELIDAYQHEVDAPIYVSLNQLIDIVEFPIKTKGRKAKGWFIKEENSFNLDINKNYIEVKGTKLSLNSAEHFFYNDEIYIIEDKIRQWFPLEYSINFNAQFLKLEPLVLLPFQEKKVRDVKRNVLLRQVKKKTYEKIIPEYSLYSYPQADITLDYIASGSDYKEEPKSAANYSGSIISELGRHTNKLFFTGDKRQLTSLRLEGSKLDPNNNLFNKGVSQYSFGDIASAPLSLINGATLGRGFKLSTYDLNRSDSFSRKSFEGNINPGWEVELYRNDQLISFQTVGSNGRYLFQDVDVLYGENTFKLIFYGPQGQVEEKVQRVNIDSNLLKKNDFNYLVSVNQKGKGLFNIGSRAAETLNRAVVRGEYGLTKKYTLNTALAIDEFLDLQNRKKSTIFQSFSFIKEVFGVLNNIDLAVDYSNFSYGVRQNAVTNYKNTNISFNQVFYQNYLNEDLARNNDPTKWRGDVNLNKVVSLYFLKNIGVNFNISQEITRSLRKISTVNNSINFVYKGYAFSNSLSYRKISDSDDLVLGNFNVRANHDTGFLRAGVIYDLTQVNVINSVSLSYQTQTEREYILRADLNHSFDGEELTSLATSVNKRYKNLLLGVNTSVDTQENYQIGATITFSLNKPANAEYAMQSDSYSNNGSMDAFAFLDENYNKKFDEKEQVIDANFKRANQIIETKKGKKTYVQDLPANSFTDVSIDLLSLEDPLWYPATEGYSIFSRPSKNISLSFPVQKTAEVEGFVHNINAIGDESPISGMKVHLVDQKGVLVKTLTTEFDGYFMFEKVIPGTYLLTPDEKQINSLELTQIGTVKVKVDGSEDFYTDNYISLESLNQEDVSLEEPTFDVEISDDFIGPKMN